MPRKASRKNRRGRKSSSHRQRSTRRKNSTRRNKRVKRKKTRKGRRKMNSFFKLMLKAKRSGKELFFYKGKKYIKKITKTGMGVFKKA